MAKPRTFISSTCFDLKDARAALAAHLRELGHEPLLSESAGFGVAPKRHSHDACLEQVDTCDYFILIIGSRRGGTYVGSERSITNEEHARAMRKNKPVITFIKRDVQTAFSVFKRNPQANLSDLVDDVRIFDFVDMVSSRAEDNWLRPFESVEEIKEAITAQFAYICLLYSRMLIAERSPNRDRSDDNVEVVRFPSNIPKAIVGCGAAQAAGVTRGLRSLHKVISNIQRSAVAGKKEKLKFLWVFGRYAEHQLHGLAIDIERLKQYTWGISKGRRVCTQIRDFGVQASYDDEPNDDSYKAHLSFAKDPESEISWALVQYVQDLLEGGDEDWACERFNRADMTIYE